MSLNDVGDAHVKNTYFIKDSLFEYCPAIADQKVHVSSI